MLSNTAVPKYYGMFREAVLSGEIPVCREISQQMNRIDRLIENPRYYYDDKAIDGFIEFCNNELTLTDGSNYYMLDSFKLWAEDLYGWYYFVERSVPVIQQDGSVQYERKKIKQRLRNKQVIVLGRGGAKSMYDMDIQGFHLTCDRSSTHQVTTAPTMRQGDEVLSPLRTAITRARGPLFKFLTEGSIQNTTGDRAKRVKLCSTKKGIENFMTNSLLEIKPMSIDKCQGLRTKINTIDEWLSGDVREDVIGALEQGASKIRDYVIVATSSEGTVRNGSGDDVTLEMKSILKGDYKNDHVSIWWYKLDDVSEVRDPRLWIKANPNLGKTVSYETYQLEVERAEKVPSARNDILAKRFGIPSEGYTYYFTYAETLPHRRRDYWQMKCSMGADLSKGDDFCSFCFLFPLPGFKFGIKIRSYITEKTLNNLSLSMRRKYDEFMQEGTLIVMPGTILNMMEIYEDLYNYVEESEYDVLTFGYDPYNAREFVERWVSEHGEYGVLKVPQGSKTESVPLGELKKLAEDRCLLFDEQMMSFGMGNAIALEDTNGNRKLAKKRSDEKIDPVAAMMDAYIAWKAKQDMYE